MSAKKKPASRPRVVRQSARAVAAGVRASAMPEAAAEDTDEKIARVLARIAGGELLTAACTAERLSHATLYAWRDAAPAHKTRYASAREAQAHKIAEDALAIADDASGDTRYGPRDTLMPDTEYAARSRLRFDARRWFVSKVAPTLYGDKLDVTTDGKEFPPFVVRIERE